MSHDVSMMVFHPILVPLLKALALMLGLGGLMGLGWSTLGTPILAGWVALFRGRDRSRNRLEKNASEASLSIEILLAAYNEERLIEATLESLVAAVRELRGTGIDVRACIRVGLDHCTDATSEKVARCALAARVLGGSDAVEIRGEVNPGPRGKWNVLNHLIQSSSLDSDWVALVDCGSVWKSGLLRAAMPSFSQDEVFGVAPAYAPIRSGMLEQLNWRLERLIKRSENELGGPVSVHGATVIYRRDRLQRALLSLLPAAWLNDDVVIPLTLRLQNPRQRLVYLDTENWVSDLGISEDLEVEFRRRQRMVVGNLQWIREILFPSALILLIASRRVARLFWAYWVLGIGMSMLLGVFLLSREVQGARQMTELLVLELAIAASAWALLGGILFSNWIRRLVVAFGSGLFVLKALRDWGKQTAQGVSWN